MPEFWVSSGHHLTRRAEGGGLLVTDELLLAYLARPELAAPEIAALADPDARENWETMLAFRDRLLAARTVEAAYLDLARHGVGATPPLFLNQLVHLILRNALDGCEDPYVLRAAELFFRPQRVSFHDGAVLLADAEIVEAHEAGASRSPSRPYFRA